MFSRLKQKNKARLTDSLLIMSSVNSYRGAMVENDHASQLVDLNPPESARSSSPLTGDCGSEKNTMVVRDGSIPTHASV